MTMEYKTAWKKYTPADLEALEALNAGYKAFLDKGKTERECVAEAVRLAEAAGYMPLETALRCRRRMVPGDKIYAVCMNKALALFQLGEEPLENGMNILGAHIDSPRVDVKQNPLYESDGQAYLDTHYYGGIKKYQWVAQPMAIHGVLVKKDGTAADVVIGEDENDPVLVFSDLLVHLAGNQMDKKAGQVITGEGLDLLVGNRPLEESKLEKDQKEAVRANVLALLKDKYGMEEGDFLSAELEIVPAGKARDCGLDRSMILAYGQDDRVCAYTSLWAMLQEDKPLKRTSCCLLVDKEEIGSVGASGMQSRFFENVVAEILHALGGYSGLSTRRCLANSYMLSSDVSSAFDSLYASAYDKKNCAYLGKGMVLMKFTGSRGKSGSNDASAETMAKIISIMDEAKVYWQIGELGAVDEGGGGTVALYVAAMDVDVVDLGVPVLCMHSPFELTSKLDVYYTYKAFAAFLASDK